MKLNRSIESPSPGQAQASARARARTVANHWGTATLVGLGTTCGALGGTPLWSLANSQVLSPNVYQVGIVQLPGHEISGTVLSRTRTDWFWAHDDATNPDLFAFRSDGTVIGTWYVEDYYPRDTEDISTDSEGRIYLADTGDNNQTRASVQVIRLREPKLTDPTVAIDQAWPLVWPDRARDVEAMVIYGDHGWFITKIRVAGDRTLLARFPLQGRADGVPGPIEIVGEIPITDPVAGADVTPDGQLFAITSKQTAFVWRVDGDLTRATREKPFFSLNQTDTKKESATFVPQGLLVITETKEMYLYHADAFRPTAYPVIGLTVSPAKPSVALNWAATLGVACSIETSTSVLANQPWVSVAEVPGLGAHTRWTSPLAPVDSQYFRVRIGSAR